MSIIRNFEPSTNETVLMQKVTVTSGADYQVSVDTVTNTKRRARVNPNEKRTKADEQERHDGETRNRQISRSNPVGKVFLGGSPI